MIVVLLEMLSGASLLVVPFLSLRTQLPRPLCLCVIMMFLTKITLNGFRGGKKKHKGVLFAFSFFSKVLTSYYKCQDKGGIFFFLNYNYYHCHYYCVDSLLHPSSIQARCRGMDVSARARRWHSLLCRSFS